jgi:abortive infection bacteriophage resistance protein
MQKFSSDDLYIKAKKKGILTTRGDKDTFSKFSYYQTINAYKSIFISKVKTFGDIENDINGSSTDLIAYYEKYYKLKCIIKSDFILNIGNEILKKYGLAKKTSISDCKSLLSKLNYVHHIYDPRSCLSDFIRLYRFEHGLRSILLNYVLIIEENIKTEFTNVLNALKEVESNFLFNLNNYNLTEKQNEVVLSIKKVYDKLGNKHSKMFERKRKQELLPPYWILIQSLTMNETYNLISNLNSEFRDLVFANVMFRFSDYRFNYDTKTDSDMKKVKSFSYIISRIGMFRNILAHNSPIYHYNVSDISLNNFPIITYDQPHKNKGESDSKYNSRKTRIIASEFALLRDLFGSDLYNSRSSYNNLNFNLAHMIYIIKRVIDRIDPKNNFSEEIKRIFTDYNIINVSKKHIKFELSDIKIMKDSLNDTINKMSQIDLMQIPTLVIDKQPYKAYTKRSQTVITESIKTLNKLYSKLNVQKPKSEFPPFIFIKNYSRYTGINQKFLVDFL